MNVGDGFMRTVQRTASRMRVAMTGSALSVLMYFHEKFFFGVPQVSLVTIP